MKYKFYPAISGLVLFSMLFSVLYFPARSHIDLIFFRLIPWVSMTAIVVVIFIANRQSDQIKRDFVVLDYLIISFCLLLFLVVIVNFDRTNYFGSLGIIWKYVLPVSLYLAYRSGFLGLNFFNIMLFLFSILLANLTILESFLQNIAAILIYGDEHAENAYNIQRQGVRVMFDSAVKMSRARGAASYAQITGSLHAVLALFYLNTLLVRGKKSSFLKEIMRNISIKQERTIMLLGLSLTILALYLTGSGTAWLILCIGTIIIYSSRYNAPLLLMFLLMIALIPIVFIAFLQKTDFVGYYDQLVLVVFNAIINYVKFVFNNFSIHALFGFREQSIVSSFSSETAFFNQLVEIGIVPFVCLLLLLGHCFKIMLVFYKNNKNMLYLPLMPICLFVGTVHYDSVFMYPNNLLFYAAIGMSVNMFYQAKNR